MNQAENPTPRQRNAVGQGHGCTQRSRGTRREFFRAIGRAAAGAGLVGLGAVLAFSGRGRAAEDPCLRMGICRGCDRADDCGLPQALSLRQALRDGAVKGGPSGV